jgi:hypothetical protein
MFDIIEEYPQAKNWKTRSCTEWLSMTILCVFFIYAYVFSNNSEHRIQHEVRDDDSIEFIRGSSESSQWGLPVFTMDIAIQLSNT